uniref:ATP synthase complex subunit 8 n=1 Tax=Phaeognathus hubrichti TaxID=52110 RepID=Q644D5_PHAHU|nr:ATP synthase F0 subunit 8 [Phaeognathus hubrichti]AAU20699.1 ATP synthase F0 subunit 8 [Phaeognathus hubrichti]
MPQLNPGPWFFIFTMLWLIYLIILLSKTNNLKTLNEPTTQNMNNKPQSWNWPWI